jgi:hypothetical protein
VKPPRVGHPVRDSGEEISRLGQPPMISGKRVQAPRTLIEKYPELRTIADAVEDRDEDQSEDQFTLSS